MRILVCGGRDFNRYVDLYRTMDALDDERGPIKTVIVGGAPGADYWAESWAWMGRPARDFVVFRADWKTHGSMAGPLRNQRMLDEGRPDLVVAFPGGRGTNDMKRRARAAGIEVIEPRLPAPIPALWSHPR